MRQKSKHKLGLMRNFKESIKKNRKWKEILLWIIAQNHKTSNLMPMISLLDLTMVSISFQPTLKAVWVVHQRHHHSNNKRSPSHKMMSLTSTSATLNPNNSNNRNKITSRHNNRSQCLLKSMCKAIIWLVMICLIYLAADQVKLTKCLLLSNKRLVKTLWISSMI